MAIRYFAIAAGVVFALVSLLGFVPGINVEGPPNAPPVTVSSFYGYLLGLFPVNLVHNLVHLAIGTWGIFAYTRGIPDSRAFARGLAVLYAVLAAYFGWIHRVGVGDRVRDRTGDLVSH